MLEQILTFAFPLFELACGIAILVRFRGSLGTILGGLAFLTFFATSVTQQILIDLEVDWWEYRIAFPICNLAAYGLLLVGILTARVHEQAPADEHEEDPRAHRGPMSITDVLFSFRGRISRSEYWLKGFLILLPLSIITNTLMYVFASNPARVVAMALSVISLWPSFAILIKRWHDRNRSAWLLMIMLIPILNIGFIIWLMIEIWFLPGTEGRNRFGSDPLPPGGEV